MDRVVNVFWVVLLVVLIEDGVERCGGVARCIQKFDQFGESDGGYLC